MTIHEIPNLEAFTTKNDSSVLAQIYTSYGVPINDFQQMYGQMLTSGNQVLGLPRPVWIAFSDFENFKVPQIHFESFPGNDGEVVAYQHNIDMYLPKSCFVYLSTPYKDGPKVYDDAESILEKTRGLFCLIFGKNFLYKKIMSAEIGNPPSDNIRSTESFKICAAAYGPYPHVGGVQEVEEIACAISRLDNDAERKMINHAIHYFNRGLDDEDAFLFLWTSLEIICGNAEHGHNKAIYICKALRKIYPNTNVNIELGFDELDKHRNNWLHRGQVALVDHDVIQYMQVMFLDLLRHRLKLAFKAHIKNFLDCKRFNLSDIGLSSNGISRDRPLPNRAPFPEEQAARASVWRKIAE